VGEPWRPQFNLFTLMLVMVVSSVLAAGLYYVIRGMRSPELGSGAGVIFIVAAPVLLLVVAALLWQIYKWTREENDELHRE
jgi:hypothetical protein